jgi:hypothetical protein
LTISSSLVHVPLVPTPTTATPSAHESGAPITTARKSAQIVRLVAHDVFDEDREAVPRCCSVPNIDRISRDLVSIHLPRELSSKIGRCESNLLNIVSTVEYAAGSSDLQLKRPRNLPEGFRRRPCVTLGLRRGRLA